MGPEEIGTQNGFVDIRDVETPFVLVVSDFNGLLAGAIGLNRGAIGGDEVHAGWLGTVLTCGRHDADLCARVDQEVRA